MKDLNESNDGRPAPDGMRQRVTRFFNKFPNPRRWWLVVILPVYMVGVFSAVLRGNNVIHDVLDATRDSFMNQKCDQAQFMSKAKLNTTTHGALFWRATPVTTVTTAIFDNPVCFGSLVTSMPKYSGHYEIEVYDEATGKIVLKIVKE